MQSVPQLACVPNRAPQSRDKTPEPQPAEIELRPSLLMSKRPRDEPAFSRRQFQTARQTSTPQFQTK